MRKCTDLCITPSVYLQDRHFHLVSILSERGSVVEYRRVRICFAKKHYQCKPLKGNTLYMATIPYSV